LARKAKYLKLRIGRNSVARKGRDIIPRVGRTPLVK
jgi:hypothetical protein